MNTNLEKCDTCGRLFSAPEGMIRCRNCTENEQKAYRLVEDAVLVEGLTNSEDIARALDTDIDTVESVLEELGYLSEQVESTRPCRLCGERQRKHGREYCTICLVNLAADLRDMQTIVNRQMEIRNRRPESRLRNISVESALREKQRRTGHHRFDPVPPNIKRGR